MRITALILSAFLMVLITSVRAETMVSNVDNPKNPPKNPELIASWDFDNPSDAQDIETGFSISGNYKFVEGVVGKSLKMDGFTTQVQSPNLAAEKLEDGFSVEAYVALATYPWNWSPVVCQHDKQRSGFYFGIGPRGEIGLSLSVNDEWIECKTEKGIELKEWTHIAATYDSQKGIEVYINGQLEASQKVTGKMYIKSNIDILMGRNREKVMQSDPVRSYGTLPSWFSIDGMSDEVKLYSGVIGKEVIDQGTSRLAAAAKPDMPQRIMPSGPTGPGKFGAYYTELKYYEEWDALWRVSDHADIVVQFDNSPIKVVFWRGTRYSPVWVMENGQWMADQSAENFNTQEGCFEHMIDPKCLYSHVRIIENTDSRVVVHWRYIPISVRKNFSQVDEVSGWMDCVDEYFTFYPDGIGIRKVIEHNTGVPLHPSEAIVLCQPGTTPEDNVHLDAMTLVNMKGDNHTYSWADGAPEFKKGENPPNPVVQIVNLKSVNKPFTIFEPENNMAVFGIEQREDVSHFPWWNHWPVAQNPSDGRYCVAPDRASHFSLAWGRPPHHLGENDTYWYTWIYGASTQSPAELARLARSWNNPPEVTTSAKGLKNKGYDKTQRAYLFNWEGQGAPGTIDLSVAASEESPMVNACFVIENVDGKVAKVTNGRKTLTEGVDYTISEVNKLGSDKLLVWVSNISDNKNSYKLYFK